MKVLIIGSGGREHAILKKVLESNKVEKVYCAPGNAGMEALAECTYIPPDNVDMLLKFAKKNQIDLAIVGPELPLTLGIVDAFEQEKLKIFGPSKAASMLEGSKIYTKEFCQRYGIETATSELFEETSLAKEYIKKQKKYPIVIKADGLAAGKGVVIAQNEEQALVAINDMMLYEKFGNAGRRIIIEEFLKGEEASFIVVCDGKNFVVFPASQDHKPVFDGDKGPNTGGMGAYAPAPIITPALRKDVIENIIKPTIAGMAAENKPYVGFLYAGLIISSDGKPKLLEYNCRLGDPEAEVLLPLLKSDFVELILAALDGKLDSYEPVFESKTAVCVVMASEGYPGAYKKGILITGCDSIDDKNIDVYHAGTKRAEEGFITNGGRVLTVTAKDRDLKTAIAKAYQGVKQIKWEGVHYRKDIGKKGLRR
ncbi:MAG: phosphoribosylamine--glycine ligase [bacterium]|nr:phosphoribosylamine--glycine ligase [bacterium]MBU1918265.1 phosphoribosylamine--glycine ligase [bacterium]